MKNYKTKRDFWAVFLHICMMILSSMPGFSQPSISEISKWNELEYRDLSNWAAHPEKADPSDSTPLALQTRIKMETGVDVFFIHPTSYTGEKIFGWNASVEDDDLNHQTDYSSILYQASVFNDGNRIFAPRYRQAHISAYYSNEDSSKIALDLAYNDVRSAFIYYMYHYHNGHPIIIASHSQGTTHASRLLKEFFENKPLMNKLVCAYIIGMPIPSDYFRGIHPCRDSTETGCFVGWRTFKKKYVPAFVEKEKFKSVVVNPLSWKTDEEWISDKFNKGGIMMKFNKVVRNIVDAQVHGNILWSCKPNVFGKIFIRKKNFHIGDINLFYINIRENVRCRVNKYNSNNRLL